MNNKIKLININKLKRHEQISKKHVQEIMLKIISDGKFTKPIIVDKKSLVILDGHHRYMALKKMKIKKIPVQLVDYQNDNIRVYLRRQNILEKLIKDAVLLNASENKLYPVKTTRHLIKNRLYKINFSLERLNI